MKVLHILLLILLSLNLTFARSMPWGNGQSKASHLQFYLVTFGPGDDIPSYWGHTALVVEDTVLHAQAIYNFGLYSFDEDMLMRFAMGRLIFEVGRASVASYFNYYRSENREIRTTQLNIPLNHRLWLARKLEWYVRPENKKYLYHHYFDNCATRLRDLLNTAWDGQFHKATSQIATMTLRDHTRRYTARNPALEFILMFLMSDAIDRPIQQWDEMFLPDELERHVVNFTYVDSLGQKHRAAQQPVIRFKANRPATPTTPPPHEWLFLIIGVAIAGVILTTVWLGIRHSFQWLELLFSIYNFIIGIALGIPGLVLFFMSYFTEHDVTYHNENLFLAHPLTILIALFSIALAWQKPWAFKFLRKLWHLQLAGALVLIALKLLPAFDQDNLMIFCFILPIDLSMVAAFEWFNQTLYRNFSRK